MKAKGKAPEMEHQTLSEFEIKRRKKEECLQKMLSPMEGYIMSIQSILVWENPKFSLGVLCAVSLLFWLATTVRIFYLIGMTGAITVFLSMWTNYIWPEIRVPLSPDEAEGWTPVHPHLLSVPELCCHLSTGLVYTESLVEGAVNMRKRSHAKFFFCCIVTCSCLAIVGHYIPGIQLAYFFVLSVLLGPAAFYHSIPQQLLQYIQPHITKMEEKLNIKRKRTKKGRGKPKAPPGGDQGVAMETSVTHDSDDEDDSDHDISEFVPPVTPEVKAGVAMATLLVPEESEEESTGLTPIGGATPERSPSPTHSSHNNSDLSDTELQGAYTVEDDSVSLQSSDYSTFLPPVNDMPSISSRALDSQSEFSLDVDTMPSLASLDTIRGDDDSPQDIGGQEGDVTLTPPDTPPAGSHDPVSHDPDKDRDTSSPESMRFVSSHFKDSPSPSDKDSDPGDTQGLEEGLSFPDVEEVDSGASGGDDSNQGLLGQGQAAVTAALANPMVSSAISSIMTGTMAGLTSIKSTVGAAIQQQTRQYTEEEEQSVVEQMAEAVGDHDNGNHQDHVAMATTDTLNKQSSQDEISEEFEFLDQEDLDDTGDLDLDKGHDPEVKESP